MAIRMQKLTPLTFFIRWFGAVILVIGTYNPTPNHFISWVSEDTSSASLKVVVTFVFLLGYIIYFRATLQSIGKIGILIALLFSGSLFWLLSDYNLFDFNNGEMVTWATLIVLATIMAVGLSWSFIRRTLSGQIDGSGM